MEKLLSCSSMRRDVQRLPKKSLGRRFLLFSLLCLFSVSTLIGQVQRIANGNMEAATGWKVYNLGSATPATLEWNYIAAKPTQGIGGCLRITSAVATDVLVWQKIVAKAGEVYTVDGAIKTNNVASFWAELYVSTVAPIEGQGYTPSSNGDVIEGFSTWSGCGPNVDGTFFANACTGKNSVTIPGTSGTDVEVYFGVKVGSMANPLPNALEVMIDELQMKRTAATGNSITAVSLGTVTTSSITIPTNIRAAQLKSAITVSPYATFDVVTSAGASVAGTATVTSAMKVKVTSESGVAKTYSISASTTAISTTALSNYTGTVTSYLNKIVTVGGASSITISAATDPLKGSTLNLTSTDVWLYFPAIAPSVIVSKHLGNLLIGGAAAVANENVRVVQYLQGTMVISQPATYQALTVYTGTNNAGTTMTCGNYTFYRTAELGMFDNNIESFILKRGYMVTLAANADGIGISQNYVADKADIKVYGLPSGLGNAVSFIRVIPWRWATKKGWAGSKDGAAPLRCGWHYDWNNAENSSVDVEYIPMRHNEWWNSYDNINNKLNTTHALGFNEPDRPDQANLTVAKSIQLWPELLKSGLRLGSPCPSDGNPGWVFDFVKKADSLNLRVDFVPVHWYKGGQTASQFYSWLKWIYDNTKKPIWITEWNNGANWTCCLPTYAEQATDVASFMAMLDTTSFVERYALYEWVQPERYMYYEYGVSLTPAGQVYRDKVSPSAYNQSVKKVVVPGETYSIIARHSGKALDVSQQSLLDGALIDQWAYWGGANQKWVISYASDGFYKIVGVQSGKALDANGTANSTQVVQNTYTGSDTQQWRLVDLGNGYFKIVNKASEKNIDIVGGTVDGAKAIIYDWWGNTNQQFQINQLTNLKSAQIDLPVEEINDAFTIYPNPVVDVLTISSKHPVVSAAVYSASGNLVDGCNVVDNNQLNVSGLQPGIYVLKLYDGESLMVTKFIKAQ